MFLPFSCCFSFFFSRVLKIFGGTPGFLGKSAHSELALFALYSLVVTFPCGIVHILVMIRLSVVYGGRRVGQVLPSYQNGQISALDETADAPQSSLFSLLSFLFSLCFFSLLFLSSSQSSQFSEYLLISLLQIQVTRGPLAVPSQVARGCSYGRLPFFLGDNAHCAKVCSSPGEKSEPPGRLP